VKESFKTCIRKYVVFNGRATRAEFWPFWLICVVIFQLSVISQIDILHYLVFDALILPLLAATSRRMHDVGKTAPWMLIPFANFFLLLRPSVGDNEFGMKES